MFVQLCTKSVPNALKEHRIYNTLVKQNVFMSVLFIRWFLGSPPSGTYTSFTSPPCFIPPWTFLCLLTHQLYSYCLQGRLAYYIKQNLFRWIGVFLRITKKESEWFSIETSPTWYAILKYARTMINKLRRLDGRGHFKALFTSFSRRALHKDIGTCSNFKAKYWSFTLLYHNSLWPKNVMLESLMQI